MGRLQRVEYEGLHVICLNNGKYKRSLETFLKLYQALEKPVTMEQVGGPHTLLASVEILEES